MSGSGGRLLSGAVRRARLFARSIRLQLYLLHALNVVDLLATLAWVESGTLTEANPIMAGAYAGGPAAFSAAKIGLVTAATLGLWRARRHRWARVAAPLLCAVYACLSLLHIGWALAAIAQS